MDLKDSFSYSLKSLGLRSLRSWLTITGVVIGVMALVVILSVSEGFDKSINDQLSAFGPNQLIIFPSSSTQNLLSFGRAPTSGKLFENDVDSINSVPGVARVSRGVYGRASLQYKAKNLTATVYGIDREFFDMYANYINVSTGRIFDKNERGVSIFGFDAANNLFGKDVVRVGSVVAMNGRDFRVVGIQDKIGGVGGGAGGDDSNIYIPFDQGRDLFAGQLVPNEVGLIYVEAENGSDVNHIKDQIERKLASNHRVKLDELDFSVITQAQILDTVNSVLSLAQIVLGAVTLIASAVGAIGISNTMFMNVLERTKEIGIIKALGATRRDILSIFLIEAAIIGLAGGLIGLILGAGALQIIAGFGVPVFLRLRIIAFVFIFSVGTGLAAGAIPAYRASNLDPVDALMD
ncbi:MAG: ABC transporter permease [Candidatus Micrarchaeia archaeon]